MKKVKATTVVELILEGAQLNKKNVEVTFYPAYDKKIHHMFPPALINSLKKPKKSVFNILSESLAIISLTKSKDVKSINWK